MIRLEDAQRFVLDRVPPPRAEMVTISDVAGLVLAEPLVATEPTPPFDNTAVDGFALRSADVAVVPTTLRIVGEVRAGSGVLPTVGEGEAVRIMTGAPIPPGADAVVMVEDTEVDGDTVVVRTSTPKGYSIRPTGDSVKAGEIVLEAGTILRPLHLGVIAELGRKAVPVYRRIRVGVISTGDELVGDGGPLGPGQIRESNSSILIGLLAEIGCEPVNYGIVPDEEAVLTAAFTRAVDECDALVTSGGVSMGEYDLVKVLLDKLGVMEWMQIAIKPAKPFAFAVLGPPERPVPVFGLPGNPVSSFVSFEVLARPALRQMMGDPAPFLPIVRAFAGRPITRRMGDGKVHLVRVIASHREDGRTAVEPAGAQGSHQLASSVDANALALVDDGEVVGPGDAVRILYFG